MRRLTEDPVLSELIVQDYRRAGLDEKTRAMLDYAIKITRTPVDCEEADIEKLQALGFSLDDVYDIIAYDASRKEKEGEGARVICFRSVGDYMLALLRQSALDGAVGFF